jgi:hypothetical protein
MVFQVQCQGTEDDHCCYIDDGVCQYYDGECSLRRELGSWSAVYADSRYVNDVKPHLEEADTVDCGDFPGPGKTCAICGVTG